MSEGACVVEGCKTPVYAPAGTGSLCKDHFLNFLTWRRRKGPAMFSKYAAMSMEERDTVMAEWRQTLRHDEPLPPPPTTR
jgi:hypothetical protein